MKNRKLNSLVVSYQENPTDEGFRKVYDAVVERWTSERAIDNMSRRYQIDYNDILGMALEKLWKAVDEFVYGKSDFYSFLSVAISRGCIDVHRSLKRHKGCISLEYGTDSETSEEISLLDVLPCANAEDEIIESIQKESDQRQLIANLIRKAPEKCRQALEAYVSSNFSYTEAAKLLNTSYPTVKRRVEKIAEYFNDEKFGNIHDYYTVAV